jgi:NADH-quinone oxidoreductase subunit C
VTDAPADTTEEQPEAPPPPDPARETVVEELREVIEDALLEYVNANGDLWIRVDRNAWRRTAETLKIKLGFDYFSFLSGIDWLQSPELQTRYEQVYAGDEPTAEEEVAAGETTLLTERVAGGTSRFTVLLRLYNIHRRMGVTVKADLDEANPSVESLVRVFAGADWHERETWEMFGFDFAGHPGLRHIYLPTEFEGFPLRKDFPLLARVVKPWPGLVDKEPVPGEEEEEEEGASA